MRAEIRNNRRRRATLPGYQNDISAFQIPVQNPRFVSGFQSRHKLADNREGFLPLQRAAGYPPAKRFAA
jgi:hypothetical protein